MQKQAFVLGSLLVSAAVMATADRDHAGKSGEWSAAAVNVGSRTLAAVKVPSPDATSAVVVTGAELIVRRSTGKIMGRPIAINTLAEIEWAPDSRAFVVTESDGGSVGSWHTNAYRIRSGKLEALEVSKEVAAEFQARQGGCSEEVANVAAAGWLSSEVVLLVAEAPPHSSCRDMGVIRGYEVSLSTGHILRRYDADALRRVHSTRLGSRLQGQGR